MHRLPFIVATLLIAFAMLTLSVFTVDQRQHAIIFQLGEVKDVISDPGL